jgi:arsenite methyltransferase
MKSIQVFDPPMCCSTGVCGPTVDPLLPRFAGLLAELGRAGVRVERFNLAQQPLPFVQNAEVRALLERGGAEALPAIFVDGRLALHGAYPDAATGVAWLAEAGAEGAGS